MLLQRRAAAAVCDVPGDDDLLALVLTRPNALLWYLELTRSCLKDSSLRLLLQSKYLFIVSNNFEAVFSARYNELQLIQPGMKNAFLSLSSLSSAR